MQIESIFVTDFSALYKEIAGLIQQFGTIKAALWGGLFCLAMVNEWEWGEIVASSKLKTWTEKAAATM